MLKLFLSSFFSNLLISRSENILRDIQRPIRRLKKLNNDIGRQQTKNMARKVNVEKNFFDYKAKLSLKIQKAEIRKDAQVAVET